MIDQAVIFAFVAHKGMVRKGNGQPYILHPIEVMSLVSLMSDDEEILSAAILHDTVEDTPTSIETIRSKFGDRVASLVSYETEDKRGNVDKEKTWKIRKQEAIDHIGKAEDIGAKMICLADKVSNLRSFKLGLYDEGDKFFERFNQKDPLEQYWYFKSLSKALEELKDYAVYKEYCSLVEQIFTKYTENGDKL